jgi:hypothetical protein
MIRLQLFDQASRKERPPVKTLHLFLAALVGSALLAAPALTWGAAPAASSSSQSAPPSAPPAERPAPAPNAGSLVVTYWTRGYVPTTWTGHGSSMPGRGGPVAPEGPVAHSAVPARAGVSPAEQHPVILRDGTAVTAKSLPRLAGGTVRFTDLRGTLVSVRASEVNLAATAAANHLTWTGVPAPAPAAPAAHPASPPPRH